MVLEFIRPVPAFVAVSQHADVDSDCDTETEDEATPLPPPPVASPHQRSATLQRTYGGFYSSKDLAQPMPIRLPTGQCDYSGFGASFEPPQIRSEVTKMTKNILVTDVWNGLDPNVWKEHKVTHVLSVMKADDIPPKAEAQLLQFDDCDGQCAPPKRFLIPLEDSHKADLIAILPEALAFITDALEERTDSVVLVHCFAGQSRSPSCVIAYFVDALDLSAMMAYKLANNAREIHPNHNFMAQIRQWASGKEERYNARLSTLLPFHSNESNQDMPLELEYDG